MALIALSPFAKGNYDAIQWQITDGGNGLYYEYFDFSGADNTWGGAVAEAETKTLVLDGGITLQGHIAPVTSQAEADFVNNNLIAPLGSWAIVWNGDSAIDGTVYAGAQGVLSDTSWISWTEGQAPADTIDLPGTYGVTMAGAGYGNEWQTRSPESTGIGGYVVEFSPVPEPSTLSFIGLAGTLGLLHFRRRKK